MEWIKVSPETMPPDMEQIMITVRFWNVRFDLNPPKIKKEN